MYISSGQLTGLASWFQIKTYEHNFTALVCMDIILVPVFKKILIMFIKESAFLVYTNYISHTQTLSTLTGQ
jgi:hypothetical protein